jgi:hypothetical protein
MRKKRLTKSTRKFIRFEKARIRREILDSKKQEEMIRQLYKRFSKKAAVPILPIKMEKKSSPKATIVSKDK